MRGEGISHSTAAGKFGGREPLQGFLSQFCKAMPLDMQDKLEGGKKTQKNKYFST